MANDSQIAPSPAALRLVFVGDVMLGRMVNDLLRRVAPEYPWGDAMALLHNADLRICNLECVIADHGRPWSRTPKAFHFRSDAKNVAVLTAAGIDAVSIANNHVLDFEYDAMREMLELLDHAGIQRAGAGACLDEARRPAICTVKGATVALFALTDNEPQWEAGPHSPGVLWMPIDVNDERAARLFAAVRETRPQTDLVVVSAHWGPNWGYEPLAAHVRFGHALIDAGADIVFGHSGHVFQGVELYKGRPIMYCTGDFIDDYAVDEVERNDESFVFTLEMEGARMRRMSLRPTVIIDCQARLARGDRARAIASRMARLCERLGTPAHWLAAQAILEIPGA
ncbi:MAG TPA: CapA family protein [Candidatus Binataceae bacterium]|jgi:poly-gamma-glutamate synthesis protein (capsule biosynthesis protein)|nr:CapA family protein [Candidatus Binataceae bacterium]